jgi:hypothetical protein
MSTSFLSPGWRMPTNKNQSKQSNYSIDKASQDDYISAPLTIDEFSSATMSIWFKTSTSQNNRYFLSFPEAGGSNGFDLLFVTSGIRSYIDIRSTLTSTFTYNDGNWHHVIVSYSGTNHKMYIDGVLTASNSASGTIKNAEGNFYIGGLSSLFPNYRVYLTDLNQACVFDYALSDGGVSVGQTATGQIATLYGGGSAIGNPMALPSPPTAYYPLGTSAWNGNYLAENNAIGDYVFDFDANGGGDFIDLGSSEVLFNSASGFSFSTWCKLENYSVTSYPAFCRLKTEQSSGFVIGLSASTGYQGVYMGASNTFLTARTQGDISSDFIGIWKHVVVTFDGVDRQTLSSYKIYVDGQPITLITAGGITSVPNDNRLGYGNSAGTIFNGLLSNSQIFNTSLSATEVETLYNYGSPIQTLANIPQSSNLKAWYKLDASEIYNSTTTEWSIDNNQNPSAYPSSLDFNGAATSSFIEFNNSISLNNNYTFSIWFNPDVVNKLQVLAYDTTSAIKFISLESNSTSIRVRDGVNEITFTVPTILANNWYNLVLQVSAGVAKLFLNNSESSTGSLTLNSSWGIKRINGYSNQHGGDFNFDGEMSNAQVFNTALPATGSNSVETLYNNGSPLTSMSGFTSLQGWWKLNNTTTGIEDSKGSNNGTNNGATEYAGFVNTLAGDSSGMSQANLVQSDLLTTTSYSPYALQFDGLSDKIDCGVSPFDETTGDITISAWVKRTAAAATYAPIVSATQGVGGANTQFSFQFYGNSLSLFWKGLSGLNNEVVPTSAFTVANDVWYLINFVRTGTTGRFYVNGNFIHLSTKTYDDFISTGTPNLSIGAWWFSSNASVTGSISNVALWNTSLSALELREVYNEGRPSNLNNFSGTAPIHWWQLGSNSSFTGNWICADEKGSNNGNSANMGVDALTNGVGTTANGVSSGMGVGALIGDAPYSTANAISSNMSVLAKGTDPADIPS